MILTLITALLTLAPMPIGVGLQDASQLDFINKTLTASDHVSAHSEQLNLLAKVNQAEKVLILRGPEFDSAEKLINQAKKAGVRWVGFNLEGPLTDPELAKRETQVANLAHQAGMTFLFGPTARSLQTGYKLFVVPADAIMVQSQRYESDPNYKQILTTLIGKLRAAKPGLKVWVQVSVNPPGNPNIPVDQVVARIGDLKPLADGIFVFSAPARWKTVQEVIDRMRR